MGSAIDGINKKAGDVLARRRRWPVLVFEVLLNATSMFNHGNVRLPAALDRVMRWIIVTPEMHRVHHSVTPRETNSNSGFNLRWSDRWFGTYRAEPAAGHDNMMIGIEQFRDPRELRLDRMLAQPFRDLTHSDARPGHIVMPALGAGIHDCSFRGEDERRGWPGPARP